jgi:hypothetical protein
MGGNQTAMNTNIDDTPAQSRTVLILLSMLWKWAHYQNRTALHQKLSKLQPNYRCGLSPEHLLIHQHAQKRYQIWFVLYAMAGGLFLIASLALSFWWGIPKWLFVLLLLLGLVCMALAIIRIVVSSNEALEPFEIAILELWQEERGALIDSGIVEDLHVSILVEKAHGDITESLIESATRSNLSRKTQRSMFASEFLAAYVCRYPNDEHLVGSAYTVKELALLCTKANLKDPHPPAVTTAKAE